MPIVPQGLPAWMRANDFQAYGGDVNKKNFASRGAINPKTDVGAEAFSRVASDLAALTRTAPFAVMIVLNNDTAALPPTVEYISLMTGTRTSSYSGDAPPSGFPGVASNGNGDFTVAFDAAYSDEYGVSGDLTLTQPSAQMHGAAAAFATVELVSGTQVRVRAFNAAGAAIPNGRVTLVVGSGA